MTTLFFIGVAAALIIGFAVGVIFGAGLVVKRIHHYRDTLRDPIIGDTAARATIGDLLTYLDA
jgi:hypothetical protein